MKLLISILLIAFTLSSQAITWRSTKVDDPILKGQQCTVKAYMSYGSYIYQFPSKYDQVFWPMTDANGIWQCNKSGYMSFMNDFKKLSAKEKTAIASFLKNKKHVFKTEEEALTRLEEIYKLRELTPETSNKHLRVFARWYQDLGDIQKSNSYRKIAYEEIEKQLKTEIPENIKLEYLYVAANYARLFNEVEKSNQYLSALNTAIENISNEENKDFASYLKDLAKETFNIIPGGKIDPPKSNTEDKH